jgi:hypothetical protein
MSQPKVGIVFIVFKETATENNVQHILNDLYSCNTDYISGMEWNEFDKLETLKRCKAVVHQNFFNKQSERGRK